MGLFKKGSICFLVSFSVLFSSPVNIPRIIELSKYRTNHLGYTGFNNAPEIGVYLADLAKNNNVKIAFETGSWQCVTTDFLAHHFDQVFTVDILEDSYQKAQILSKRHPNVTGFFGSSEKIFQTILPKLQGSRVLFYLDAHWDTYWPLLDELEEISLTHKDNCIIVIDDFKVPGRPDVPYDSYHGDDCSFEYVQEALDKVYTEYVYFYLVPKNPICRAKFVALPNQWVN